MDNLPEESCKWRELAESRSDFLRMTVHELRRPLSISAGYLSMLEKEDLAKMPELLSKSLVQITAGFQELRSLIDGLTELACVEDQAAVLRRECFWLDSLIREVVETIDWEIKAKRITLQCHISAPNIQVNWDRRWVRIAVVNLLSNAIKYSPQDSTIVMSITGGSQEIQIKVQDQGSGVEVEELEEIFRAWYRSPTATAPGLGLGLHIVRQIAEMHGGQVTLESQPNQGSTFILTLPY